MIARLLLAAFAGIVLAVAPSLQTFDSPPSPLPTHTETPTPEGDTPTPSDTPEPTLCDMDCAPNPPMCQSPYLWNHPLCWTPTPTPTPGNNGWARAATARSVPHYIPDRLRP